MQAYTDTDGKAMGDQLDMDFDRIAHEEDAGLGWFSAGDADSKRSGAIARFLDEDVPSPPQKIVAKCSVFFRLRTYCLFFALHIVPANLPGAALRCCGDNLRMHSGPE